MIGIGRVEGWRGSWMSGRWTRADRWGTRRRLMSCVMILGEDLGSVRLGDTAMKGYDIYTQRLTDERGKRSILSFWSGL